MSYIKYRVMYNFDASDFFVWFPSYEEQLDDLYIDYEDSDDDDDETDDSEFDIDDLDIGYA